MMYMCGGVGHAGSVSWLRELRLTMEGAGLRAAAEPVRICKPFGFMNRAAEDPVYERDR